MRRFQLTSNALDAEKRDHPCGVNLMHHSWPLRDILSQSQVLIFAFRMQCDFEHSIASSAARQVEWFMLVRSRLFNPPPDASQLASFAWIYWTARNGKSNANPLDCKSDLITRKKKRPRQRRHRSARVIIAMSHRWGLQIMPARLICQHVMTFSWFALCRQHEPLMSRTKARKTALEDNKN